MVPVCFVVFWLVDTCPLMNEEMELEGSVTLARSRTLCLCDAARRPLWFPSASSPG